MSDAIAARLVTGVWIRHVPHGAALLGRASPPADGRWQRGDVVPALYLADSETPGSMAAAWNSGDGSHRVVVVVNANFDHNAPVSAAMRKVLVRAFCPGSARAPSGVRVAGA